MHEASLHQDTQFLTLTYAPEHLPRSGSLSLDHSQKFWKIFRKATGKRLRYFMCGEYGEQLHRPHYHAIVFGHAFTDLQPLRPGLFTSPDLRSMWKLGHVSVGTVTAQSAAYVARYAVKKVNGAAAASHYRVNGRPVRPEFITMSRRPGIASEWFEKYKDDVYPSDEIIHKGKRFPTPAYYDKLLGATDENYLAAIKTHRQLLALEHAEEQTTDRLIVKEECARAKLNRNKRSYESAPEDVLCL